MSKNILHSVQLTTPFSLGSALGFVRLGVETNLFGLACPFRCGNPSFLSLSLTFLSGLGLGLGAGLALAILLAFPLVSWGSQTSPARPVPGPTCMSDQAVELLRLHAQQLLLRVDIPKTQEKGDRTGKGWSPRFRGRVRTAAAPAAPSSTRTSSNSSAEIPEVSSEALRICGNR